jgi:uroporphyrinogen decarboxylase
MKSPFAVNVMPDWEGLVDTIRREGTPARVHFIELFLDPEVQEAVCERFGITEELDPSEAHYDLKRQVALQRFLGYDFVRMGIDDIGIRLNTLMAEDTAELARNGGRGFVNEDKGPITNWEEFERYPWPDPGALTTRNLEWYEKNLPDDMCVVGSGGFAHFAEYLMWLMGYSTFCMALCEQRDLVEAISERLRTLYRAVLARILEFDRVKIVWGSDDMGFRGGLLCSPDDTREFVLLGHKEMAAMSHAAGRPYLLHSCGNLGSIMEDLIEDVGIDAKHSFEDTIEQVTDAKARFGDRIALLGGIDVDFLCRADERAVRERVRDTLDVCMPGGGYCLGTGNSVANYIPLENYLAMLDEGRRFAC